MEDFLEKIIALPLEKVDNNLNNYELIFEENNPPRQDKGKGRKRVISIKQINSHTLKIIWCYEDYEWS